MKNIDGMIEVSSVSIIKKLKLNKYKNMAVRHQPSDHDTLNGYETSLSKGHDAIF